MSEERRAYRSGTIYQRKSDGRWIASIPDGHGGRARYVTGTTREAVEKRLGELKTSTTSHPEPSSETVAAFLARWLDGERRRGRLRPRTAESYATLIKLHINPVVGRVRLPDLRPADIEHLVVTVLEHRSQQTARHVYKVMHRALGMATRWDLIPANPAAKVEAPSVRATRVPRPLSADEARRFLAATTEDERYPLYALAIATGMRRGEILALKWPDIDLAAGTVRVEKSLRQLDRYRFARDDTKTDKSRRVLPLPAVVVRALEKHQKAATTPGYVFARPDGRPLPPAEVTREFQATLTRLGFRSIRFHDLRHTAANLALDRMGGDIRAVSAMLGHATITTTVGLYGTAADDARRRAAKAMDDVFEGIG